MEKIKCYIMIFKTLVCLSSVLTLSKAQDTFSSFITESVAPKKKSDYCLTPECIHTASNILRNIDTNVDPCEDFYEFSCGRYFKKPVALDINNFIVNNIQSIRTKILHSMKDILEEKTLPTEPRYARLIKITYQNCINAINKQEENLTLNSDFLNQIGDWASLKGDSWEDVSSHWEDFESLVNDYLSLIGDSNYLEEFNLLINQISKSEQTNYLIWRAINDFLFNKMQSYKWQTCYLYVQANFKNSFGALYFQKYYKDGFTQKELFNQMVANISQQFKITLESADWMDQVTKDKALEKLASIFFVDQNFFKYQDDEIDKFYADLEITPGNYSQTMMNITNFKKNHNESSEDKTSWINQLNPMSVTAKYILRNNTIAITPSILRGVFFNENRPQYMNYGTMGFIIAHEFVHAFDQKGRYFDKLKNYVNWWKFETSYQYHSRRRCMVHQYGNFRITELDLKVRSVISSEENVADNVGVKVAYSTYEKYMRTHEPDLLLPGVNFSQRQLFWISYAQAFCEEASYNNHLKIYQSGTHSPSKFRVLGSLANSPEFASDFQCALGTKMNPENKYSDEIDFCLTPECVHTASRVLKYIETSINPCDNFYKFACGGFIKEQWTSDKIAFKKDHFIKANENIQLFIKSILEREVDYTEPKYSRLMKTFYQNCMKASGWPLLIGNSWKDDNFQWEKFGTQLINEISLENHFIFSKIREDVKNSSNMVLEIKQPSNFYKSPDYYNLIAITTKLFRAEEYNKEHDIQQILKVEKKIFNITVPNSERNDSFDRMTLKELEGNYSNILWKDYFNTFLMPVATIKDDDIILVGDSNYFKGLNLLINQISKRDQANYLTWKAVYDYITNYLDPKEVENNEWKKCYNNVGDNFHAFGFLYFRNIFDDGFIRTDGLIEMISNILEEFNATLTNTDWLDDKTKERALEKLASMFVVNPNIYNFYTDEELDEFYSNLEETYNDDYLQSMINVKLFNKYNENNLFGKAKNKTSWRNQLNPSNVNAKHIFTNNSIAISPALLRGIFFNENRPRYMNYGSLGYIIGHEITHAFDNNGRNYDKLGNLVDWWEAESSENFLSKAECFNHQYEDYTVPEVDSKIRGNKTQNENIADNGGIKVAYLAYERYVKTHGPELVLPGVNYTQRQLFWISFAQTYCERISSNVLSFLMQYDVHSPQEFRVLGSLSNRPEFARDFQCALGTEMNPENKCSVW
ncbi:neprilysin-2-like isoform X2 [Leptopilina heterotoma]|uniref:neprilysin-2-like isoform X2 n=1 Tax=Leptopilina heterotoma TaxID=63436 RepID=UPI001CA83C39|nr:neprilysin-2-like isoform X2 [Leptopilina heterotoma]